MNPVDQLRDVDVAPPFVVALQPRGVQLSEAWLGHIQIRLLPLWGNGLSETYGGAGLAFYALSNGLPVQRVGEQLLNMDHPRVLLSASFLDPVVERLGFCLRSAMSEATSSHSELIQHLSAALAARVTQRSAKRVQTATRGNGTLAPWQEQCAKAMLGGAHSVKEIARQCQLSVSHFSRSFKRTTGMPPYRWQLHSRLERSKQLLSDEQISITDVALQAGFADQAHFTRAFSKSTGISPGAWRRIQCGLAGDDKTANQCLRHRFCA